MKEMEGKRGERQKGDKGRGMKAVEEEEYVVGGRKGKESEMGGIEERGIGRG